jgi:pimeloyl-ACP methyl ester carboxylesterase
MAPTTMDSEPTTESAPTAEGAQVATPALEEATLEGGIFYRHWQVHAPRAVVLLVHGLGEHSGRYQHVAEALATARGIATLAPDHYGHGRSPGKRCFVPAFEDYFAPLDALRAMAQSRYPGRALLYHRSFHGWPDYRGLPAGAPAALRRRGFLRRRVCRPEMPGALALFVNRLIAAVCRASG